MQQSDVLVIGSGIAGCIAAWELAKQGLQVALLSAQPKGDGSNSSFAQGGVAYLGEQDSPDLFARDILEAGAGLCSPKAVQHLVDFGPRYLKELLIDELGVDFDRTHSGDLSLTMEAAHSCCRIIHHKDCTGKAIMQALLKKVESLPNIDFKRGHIAVDLITLSHHSKNLTDLYYPSTCAGAYVFDELRKEVAIHFAKQTILATGGIGEVFLHTTNPKNAYGSGLAMAYRAGARIMNMEYVQFHPTSLYVPNQKRFLLSEALRGEGAELLSWEGKPFMHAYHPSGSLAPRDITAKSIYKQMIYEGAPHLWLDISFKPREWLQGRFPTLYERCFEMGYDLTREPLPIVPAAHYACGGIAVDGEGRTSIQRLFAIGEVACTGVHGANRLASTSLLEGVVWAKRCAEAISSLKKESYYFPPVEGWVMGSKKIDSALIQQDWTSIKQTMWNYVGLERSHERLMRALRILQELKWQIDSFYEKAELTSELLMLRHGIQTALLITEGAFRNKKSLGCHSRVD
jgi:L-aspartate oxidase